MMVFLIVVLNEAVVLIVEIAVTLLVISDSKY